MKPWLKAGLAGAALGILLTLPVSLMLYLPAAPGLILGACLSALFLLLYPGVGVLAAFWSAPPRTGKQGAVDGALAGLIAFSIDGLVTLVLTVLIFSGGGMEHYMQQISPGSEVSLPGGMESASLVFSLGSTLCSTLAGVVFSALGGFVFASLKRD
jgi:hypothetical protein